MTETAGRGGDREGAGAGERLGTVFCVEDAFLIVVLLIDRKS